MRVEWAVGDARAGPLVELGDEHRGPEEHRREPQGLPAGREFTTTTGSGPDWGNSLSRARGPTTPGASSQIGHDPSHQAGRTGRIALRISRFRPEVGEQFLLLEMVGNWCMGFRQLRGDCWRQVMGEAIGVLRTVTLNSGFDDTFTVSGLDWGGVGRVRGFRSLPSGKGVNAARAAAALGVPVCAYSLVGRDDAATFSAQLQSEGIEHRLVAVPGGTRHNLTLVPESEDRVAAHLVAEGFRLPDARPVEALADRLLQDCQPGDVVSCNGSVPTGVPATVWADIVAAAHAAGATVVLDVQGDALRHALAAGPIALAKPNEAEIAALPGVNPDGPDPMADALQSLAGAGVAHPLVTLGAAGAAFLRGGRVNRASCPVERAVVAVGAGDTFLAGACAAILAGENDTVDLVAAGLAAAAAQVAGRTDDGLRAGYGQNLRRVRIEAG